jgi:hypothetical protein
MRSWDKFPNQNAAFGVDRPIENQMYNQPYNRADSGKNVWCGKPRTNPLTDGYKGQWKMARYVSGQKVRLVWPAKNHANYDCLPRDSTDYAMQLKWIANTANATQDPYSLPEWTTFWDWHQINNKQGVLAVDGVPFTNCPDFCSNTDKAVCFGDFVVPNVAAPGIYTFLWYWEFLSPDWLYSSCWEAWVDPAGSNPNPSPNTPSPTQPSGPNPGPAQTPAPTNKPTPKPTPKPTTKRPTYSGGSNPAPPQPTGGDLKSVTFELRINGGKLKRRKIKEKLMSYLWVEKTAIKFNTISSANTEIQTYITINGGYEAKAQWIADIIAMSDFRSVIQEITGGTVTINSQKTQVKPLVLEANQATTFAVTLKVTLEKIDLSNTTLRNDLVTEFEKALETIGVPAHASDVMFKVNTTTGAATFVVLTSNEDYAVAVENKASSDLLPQYNKNIKIKVSPDAKVTLVSSPTNLSESDGVRVHVHVIAMLVSILITLFAAL